MLDHAAVFALQCGGDSFAVSSSCRVSVGTPAVRFQDDGNKEATPSFPFSRYLWEQVLWMKGELGGSESCLSMLPL